MAFTTQWRGQRDTSSRCFVGLLAASTLLHVPVSPLVFVLAFLGLFALQNEVPPAPYESLNAIPIDLLEEGEGDHRDVEPKDPGTSDTDILDDWQGSRPVEDAGIPDAAEDAAFDADLDDADAEPDAAEDADADADEEEEQEEIRNPVALTAKRAKVVDSNAAVSLTVYSENVRHHPLGPRVGHLMSRLPQWEEFFGPAGLDPIQDIDRVMLVGPDFRDSSGLAVLVQHRLSNKRMYNALNTLVKEKKGRWLADAGVPAAQARAANADRIIVVPSSYMVIVAPLTAKESALTYPRLLLLPNAEGKEVLIGALKSPGFAFSKHGAPITIPSTVSSMKYWITPLPNGGGRLRFVAQDASPQDAERTLQSLQDQINTLKTVGAGAGLMAALFKDQAKKYGVAPEDLKVIVGLLNELTLSAHGSQVHGTLNGSRALAEAVISRVEQQFKIRP